MNTETYIIGSIIVLIIIPIYCTLRIFLYIRGHGRD
jgi:hypothetical protein